MSSWNKEQNISTKPVVSVDLSTFRLIFIIYKKVKSVNLVEGDQKAPFSIATTPIAPLYS